MKIFLSLLFLHIFFIGLLHSPVSYGQQRISSGQKIRIDSIRIDKNWRTRESIIREEIKISVGDSINQGVLDTMIMRVWNIGNFAKVGYDLDTNAGGVNTLTVLAKDAFTLIPILSFSGNRQDWSLALGMTDNNFLGRNIRLNIQGTLGTNAKSFQLGFSVPRQLMYKNMTASGSLLFGQGNNYRIEDGKKVLGVAYKKSQISGSISNPWHEDFKYRFSPDFGWSLFQHKADSSLVDADVPLPKNYTVNYLSLSVGESVGFVQRKRHQKNGFAGNIGISLGVGLDAHSPHYYTLNGGVEYHKLFNSVVQFSAKFKTGYTSSNIPSLQFYQGANIVKGTVTGEISGQAYYGGYLGWHMTYVNKDWFAMEQSIYFNWGNGKDKYLELYNSSPVYGIGTGFHFNIPMIPWLGFQMYFTYTGKNSNWFGLEF